MPSRQMKFRRAVNVIPNNRHRSILAAASRKILPPFDGNRKCTVKIAAHGVITLPAPSNEASSEPPRYTDKREIGSRWCCRWTGGNNFAVRLKSYRRRSGKE